MTSPAPATRPAVVGIDVGGTGIKTGLIDADLSLIAEWRHATPRDRGPHAVTQAVTDAARTAIAHCRASLGCDPRAVGVAVLGLVDEADGIARYSAAVGWRDLALRDLLSGELGLPVTLAQDLRAGGLAEALLGAGRGVRDFLFITVGTGVGAAALRDGAALAGRHGRAMEIGHLPVCGADEPCGCGGSGCVETIASAEAISRRYQQATGRALTAEQIAARVAAAEPAAEKVWNEAVGALAAALAVAVLLLDPSRIVIGGGLSLAGDLLLGPLRAALARRLPLGPPPPVIAAELGDRAAILGAALAAGLRPSLGGGGFSAGFPGRRR